MILNGYEPAKALHFFEEISNIPRGSGNEKQISDYLVKFAKDRNLWVSQDETLNVIIKKDATTGYENAPTVILQGHMDMVAEKNASTEHDFLKDPIKLVVDGDFISATGTTLGADNGIAVAMALAILDSNDIPHPSLEVLITSEEETGMIGANALDENNSQLFGSILLNLDSEEDDSFTVSCCGGIDTYVKLNTEFTSTPDNCVCKTLKVGGLKGGHSGMDINKNRGNANRLLARLLNKLSDKVLFSGINGGLKVNAIPREAYCTLFFDEKNLDYVTKVVSTTFDEFKLELATSDNEINVVLEACNCDSKPYTKELCSKIVSVLLLIPNGIQEMSVDIEGLVQTSNNIGVVESDNEEIVIKSSARSSILSQKYLLVSQIKDIANLVDAGFDSVGDYPGWAYNPNSQIRTLMTEVYKDLFKSEPKIVALHAGLECGLLLNKIHCKNADAISIGPNCFNVHTPDEKLSISSTQRTWKFLLEVLKKLK